MIAEKYREIMPSTVLELFEECESSFRHKQFFPSAIWGAVFLEVLLVEVSENVTLLQGGREDLNGMIQSLSKASARKSESDVTIPDDIPKRCNEIQLIRNRLVHHTGMAKTTVEADARMIFDHLGVILNWYKQQFELARPFIQDAKTGPSGIPVFISSVTPHAPQQEYFKTRFLKSW
jgi:hypothetical protein